MKFIKSSTAVILLLCAFNGISPDSDVTTTPEAYAKRLPVLRREHNALIQKLLKDDYSKKYTLVSIALEKIFQVIRQSNRTLNEQEYTINQGFPLDGRKQKPVTLILENTCLAADIILHFPDISYKILKKILNWRADFNWCIAFVNSFPHIIDEGAAKLIDLINQELNEAVREPDYVNPYYERSTETIQKKKSKPRKKIKKGPQLTVRVDL